VTRPDSVFSSSAAQGYFLLLVACGGGLLFSIPAGAHVSNLMEVHWNPSPVVFHLTYLTLLSLLGTFRGIAAARWDLQAWKSLPRLGAHILFGQLIVLPYMLFSRALLPGRPLVLLLLGAYAMLIAFMFSLIAFRLDRWGRARHAHTFMLQYAIFGLALLLPWALGLIPQVPGAISLFSPLCAGLRITQSASAEELAIAFAFALLMIAIQLVGIRRSTRRSHAV